MRANWWSVSRVGASGGSGLGARGTWAAAAAVFVAAPLPAVVAPVLAPAAAAAFEPGSVPDRVGCRPGRQAGLSSAGALTADGRLVVFSTRAAGLVDGDTDAYVDVFTRALDCGPTRRVSVAPGGAPPDGDSHACCASEHGRHVVFTSSAANLVAGDTNGAGDVFVRDMAGGATARLSLAADGGQVAADSTAAGISTDGRYVVFYTRAQDLASAPTHHFEDVYLRDRVAGRTELITFDTPGLWLGGKVISATVSATGRYVSWTSFDGRGPHQYSYDVFVRDRRTGTTRLVTVDLAGNSVPGQSSPSGMSADGRYITFVSDSPHLVPGDTNNAADVFVRDTHRATTGRVSVTDAGRQANQGSASPAISADGWFVAFSSAATNLAPGVASGTVDTYLRDRRRRSTARVSVAVCAGRPDGASAAVGSSRQGRLIAFTSDATNLVTADTNGAADLFVYDTVRRRTIRASVGGP